MKKYKLVTILSLLSLLISIFLSNNIVNAQNAISLSITPPIFEVMIKPDKEIRLFIQEKKVDLSKVFGTLKIKESTQKILDKIREGED